MMPCLFCGGDAGEPDHLLRCDGRQGRVEARQDEEELRVAAYAPEEHARRSDPDTSIAAAFRVENATEVQRRVVLLHRAHPEGLTDEELVACYGRQYATEGRSLESRVSPRKRRSDLTKIGVLVDSGIRRTLTSGRSGVVWILAERAA